MKSILFNSGFSDDALQVCTATKSYRRKHSFEWLVLNWKVKLTYCHRIAEWFGGDKKHPERKKSHLCTRVDWKEETRWGRCSACCWLFGVFLHTKFLKFCIGRWLQQYTLINKSYKGDLQGDTTSESSTAKAVPGNFIGNMFYLSNHTSNQTPLYSKMSVLLDCIRSEGMSLLRMQHHCWLYQAEQE